jgi:hypothetical protein
MFTTATYCMTAKGVLSHYSIHWDAGYLAESTTRTLFCGTTPRAISRCQLP